MVYYIYKDRNLMDKEKIMDFTKLTMITGMTVKELHQIPKVAIYNIIKVINDRLENTYVRKDQRDEFDYQIKCYEELMLTAK